MKTNRKAACLVVALVTLAPFLNGCRISQAEVATRAARDAEDQRILRGDAEQIPPHLAADAAAAFSKGKSYYIWLDVGERVAVPRNQPLVMKVHYAIAPDKEAVPFPYTAYLSRAGSTSALNIRFALNSRDISLERPTESGKLLAYFATLAHDLPANMKKLEMDDFRSALGDLKDTLSNVVAVQMDVQ